jgi:hypothetical protein
MTAVPSDRPCFSAGCRCYRRHWQWCVRHRLFGPLWWHLYVKRIHHHPFFAVKSSDGQLYWREWNRVGEPGVLFPKVDVNDPKTWACNLDPKRSFSVIGHRSAARV